MARINLLPWREELREQRKQQFITVLVGVLLVGVAAIFLTDKVFNHALEQQQERNQFIRQAISELDAQIKEINVLREKRKELIERTQVIQDLQGNRPIASRVFDQLVRTMPDGVYFTSLRMTGKNIAISGVAESNNLISTLMRRQAKSDWLVAPNLTEVKADDKSGVGVSIFRLNVQQTTPAANSKQGAQ